MKGLHFNEMPFSIPKKVTDDFCKLITRAHLNKYGHMRGDVLLDKLANHLSISTDNLAVGNGSDELLKVAAEAFLKKNKKLMTIEPSFIEYANYARLANGDYLAFHLGDNLEFDEKAFLELAKMNNPDMIYLSSPENPSGRVYSKDFFMKVLENTKDTILIVDEAYIELSSTLSLYKEATTNPRLICSRTFSKAYGAAGVRLGYVIATKENIEAINDRRLIFGLSQTSELMGVALLDNLELFKENIKFIKSERERIYKKLKTLNRVEVYPSQGNFFLVKVATDLDKTFLAQGIIINKVSWKNGFYRISIGDKDTNSKVLKILKGL